MSLLSLYTPYKIHGVQPLFKRTFVGENMRYHPLICIFITCHGLRTTVQSSEAHQSTRRRYEEIERHEAWSRLALFDCGESAADRIIGGVNAALGQFPWIARLGYSVPDETELDWMCGGVLVTDRHVLTAAHCVDTSSDGIKLEKIRLGEYDTRTDPDCQLRVCAPKVQDRRFSSVLSHPKFNKPPYHNDIAVIELEAPVELNNYVAPICLPQGQQLQDLPLGEQVTVAGWGKMNMSTEQRAEVLQVVSLPIVPRDKCDSLYKGMTLGATEICAGAQHNKDACGGDSGGPLMKVFDTPEGPKHVLVGVVSFGPTICGIRKPAVYTSVPYFLKWILDHV